MIMIFFVTDQTQRKFKMPLIYWRRASGTCCVVKFQKQCNNWKKLAVSCKESFSHIEQGLISDMTITFTSGLLF